MPARKLTTLTLVEKSKLIEESQNPGFAQSVAAEKYGISKSTVSRILSNKDSILRCVDSSHSNVKHSPKVHILLDCDINSIS